MAIINVSFMIFFEASKRRRMWSNTTLSEGRAAGPIAVNSATTSKRTRLFFNLDCEERDGLSPYPALSLTALSLSSAPRMAKIVSSRLCLADTKCIATDAAASYTLLRTRAVTSLSLPVNKLKKTGRLISIKGKTALGIVLEQPIPRCASKQASRAIGSAVDLRDNAGMDSRGLEGQTYET